ncbi:MAG: zf-HC2 domain-containing protein [Hydrogenophaga sp.]|uniref:zf-HC2 domain-containing protein n=1 Tax=Hydrogenophaga sp. TaxID=1904254 RepID=UPI0026393019|nr:zf-HC2 domain-containing protein [Hydrogenophaga sp.]MDM7942293.1 zf-HC2 domain-containing protein [Hydrogenophaga sp.]
MKPVYPLRRTCKEVSALLVAREDRALPLADRLALRLHMAMCQACPRFERQLLTLRSAMGQWRHYSDNDL